MNKPPVITHPDLVRSLCKPGWEIHDSLTPTQCHVLHMLIGLQGELGEIVDVIKKQIIYGQPLDRENLIEELGDIEFFLEGLRQAYDIHRDDTTNANVNKLSVRYWEGRYTNKAAAERQDKA